MSTVLTDYALSRSSWVPKLILPLDDGSGTSAADKSASPVNGTYVGSPNIGDPTQAYGCPYGTTAMLLSEGESKFCRAPTAGKLSHLVDGTVSYTIMGTFKGSGTNPNPFNYPVAIGFANNFGTYDNMMQICLNGKADGNPNGNFACFRWYTVANGSIASEINHGGGVFTDGKTHTWAAVYSTAAGGTMTIYVDAVAGSTVTGANAKAPALQAYFGIGTMVANNGTTLDRTTATGFFSDIQYFETALTAAQIAGWHSRAVNGECTTYNGRRRKMFVHGIAVSYMMAGGSEEHAKIVDETVLPAIPLELQYNNSLTNNGTGYRNHIEDDAIAMANTIADAIGTRYTANKPSIIEVYGSLFQTLKLNATLYHGYPTAPTRASLLAGAKAGRWQCAGEKSRLDILLPLIRARLDANWDGCNPTAIYHDIEYAPVVDVCYGQSGLDPEGNPSAQYLQWKDDYENLWADMVADAGLSAQMAAKRAIGVDTNNRAMDAVVRDVTAATFHYLYDPYFPSVPHFNYFWPKFAPDYYIETLNGAANCANCTGIDVGSWLWNRDGSAGLDDAKATMAIRGPYEHIPMLEHNYPDGSWTDRFTRNSAFLNWFNQDANINDLTIYLAQGSNGADTDLTNLATPIAALMPRNLLNPRIIAMDIDLFGGNLIITVDKPGLTPNPGHFTWCATVGNTDLTDPGFPYTLVVGPLDPYVIDGPRTVATSVTFDGGGVA